MIIMEGDFLSDNSDKILLGLLLSLPVYHIPDIKKYLDDIKTNTYQIFDVNPNSINKEIITGFDDTTDFNLLETQLLFIKTFLSQKMNICNSDELAKRYDEFYNRSVLSDNLTKLFAQARRIKTGRKWNTKPIKKGEPTHFDHREFILNNIHFSDNPDFMAFDISLCVLMCRFGLYLNWLSVMEATERIIMCADLAVGRYTDYDEYYIESMVAHSFYNEITHLNDIFYSDLKNHTVCAIWQSMHSSGI